MGLSPQMDAGKLKYRSKTCWEVLAEEIEVRLPDTQLQWAGAHPSISCSTPNQGKGVPGEILHGYKENMYIPHGKTELEVNPEPSALTQLWPDFGGGNRKKAYVVMILSWS